MKPRKQTDAEKALDALARAISKLGAVHDIHLGVRLFRRLSRSGIVKPHSPMVLVLGADHSGLLRSALRPWEFKIVPKDAAS